MKEEMIGGTKYRTIQSNKWVRKEYIKESATDIVKDVIKIQEQTQQNIKKGMTQ